MTRILCTGKILLNSFILPVYFVAILISCTGFEPVTIENPDLSVNDATPILVAEGSIEEGSTVRLRLTYSKGISVDTTVPTVCVQNIEPPTLLSSDGIVENLTYSGDGRYVGGSILGEINTSYTLTFTVNGITYSATATMYTGVVIDTGFVREYSKLAKGQLYIYYQPIWRIIDNPTTRDYYLFRFAIKGVYDPSLTVAVDDDRYANSNGTVQINHERIWLKEGGALRVFASRIDKQTYTYYNQLEKLKWMQSTGDVTPYNPISNFGHGTMGYFRALSSTSVDIAKLIVSDFIAMPDSGKNELTWTHSPGAVKYTIYWASDSAVTTLSDSIVIDSIVTSCNHTGLTNGITYYYKLKATDAFGATSGLSASVYSTPSVLIPPDFNVRSGNREIIVFWNKVPIATGYTIFWATDTGVSEQSDSIILDANITSFTHTGLVNDTTYYYRMSTQSATGSSSILSIQKEARPDSITIDTLAPQNVVTASGAHEIVLTWNPVNDTAWYVLFYDTIPWVNGASIRIDSVTSPYTHIALAAGRSYYYRVASRLGNNWHLSAEVNAIPDSMIVPDQAPKNVTATAAADTNEVTITWDPVPNAVGYKIYWDTQPWVSTWSNSIDSVTSPYTHVGLDTGSTYFYRIVSKFGSAEYFSMEVSATVRQ